MDTKGRPSCVTCEEKRFASQMFSRLLDDLIWHVGRQDFDTKIFNELYLELLSCASQIFGLEKKLYGLRNSYHFCEEAIPYQTFGKQLAELNKKCSEKGMAHAHSMLEFLLDWSSRKYSAGATGPEDKIHACDLDLAC